MIRLTGCLPNFSEGCDRRGISAIADIIVAAGGVRWFDVDPGVLRGLQPTSSVAYIPYACTIPIIEGSFLQGKEL